MRTQAPGFWNDPKAAEKIVKQVRELKAWIEGCENVSRSIDDLNVLFEFAKEGEATEEEVDAHYAETLQLVEALELKNMLQGEADQMSCVLKINSGAGAGSVQAAGFSSGKRLFSGKQPSSILKSAAAPIL